MSWLRAVRDSFLFYVGAIAVIVVTLAVIGAVGLVVAAVLPRPIAVVVIAGGGFLAFVSVLAGTLNWWVNRP